MNNAGRAYVLSATMAVVAVVDRAGWIGWPALDRIAVIGISAMEWIALVLILTALVLGLPTLLLTAATIGFLGLMPKQHRVEPSA